MLVDALMRKSCCMADSSTFTTNAMTKRAGKSGKTNAKLGSEPINKACDVPKMNNEWCLFSWSDQKTERFCWCVVLPEDGRYPPPPNSCFQETVASTDHPWHTLQRCAPHPTARLDLHCAQGPPPSAMLHCPRGRTFACDTSGSGDTSWRVPWQPRVRESSCHWDMGPFTGYRNSRRPTGLSSGRPTC